MAQETILLDLPENGTLRPLVLAIDYDGVLDLAPWPSTGQLHPQAAIVMRLLRDLGHTLILYTCRSGQALAAAIEFLHRRDVPFHYVNENTPERIAQYGGDCRKISADLYLDDKSACLHGGVIDWIDFYYQVIQLAAKAE